MMEGPGARHARAEKIAVLRANSIGDFVFTLPALGALREAFPHAHISLLAKQWHREFLEGRDCPVDRVVVLPPVPGVSEEPGTPQSAQDLAELERFVSAMKNERFDVALQLHGGGAHSNPLTLALGAGTTVGMRDHDAPPLDVWVPYVYYQNEVLRLLEVVGLLGARTANIEPCLAPRRTDLEEADDLLAPIAAHTGPLVVLHPGATDGRRRWPTEKFAAVADGLIERGARGVLVGAEAEAQVVGQTLAKMKHGALDLCGKTTIGGLAGVLTRCSLAVCNDSGPLHLSLAVGARAVGIFWCGNMINAGPMGRARFRPAISWRLECPVCGTDCMRAACPHDSSFTADVDEDEVLRLCLELLSEIERGRAADARVPLRNPR